jgi:type II secretory pathway pseudopilin PulG
MNIFNKHNKAFYLIELSIVILIIGILVAGVTSSSRLIKRMKLITAQNLTRNSPVSSIKDLSIWIESALDESFDNNEEADGANITNWYDINPQTSFKFTVNQSNLANKPVFVEAGINGIPSIKFDGNSSDYMLLPNYNFSNNKITIFLVTNRIIGNDSGTATLDGVDPAYGNDWADPGSIQIWEVSSQFKAWKGGGSFPLSFFTHPGNGVPYIASVTFDGTNNLVYLNGTASSPVAYSGNISLKNLYIACRYLGGPTIFYSGYISEVIIFSRLLNTEERKSVETYLSKKYAIKVL